MEWALLISRVVGVFISFSAWLRNWGQRRIGREQQAAADDRQSIQEAKRGKKIDTSVNGMSDAELDAELREYTLDQ